MGIPRPTRRRVAPADGDGGGPQTFDGTVDASSDDARQTGDDSVDLTATSYLLDSAEEHGGLRWTNVTIPGGATIDLAQMGIYVRGGTQDEPLHQLRGHLTADAATFAAVGDNIDGRSRTTATVDWDDNNLGAALNELWEWGAVVAGSGNGVDISSIIQEIVDVGGWASGNAMVLIFEQPATQGARDLGFATFDNAGVFQSTLHIEFTT